MCAIARKLLTTMAGSRQAPVAVIAPELPVDGVSEVESDRPGNAKFGYGPHLLGPSGIAAGNLGMIGKPAIDNGGPTPFAGLKGRR
jgi:hypothetical protein